MNEPKHRTAIARILASAGVGVLVMAVAGGVTGQDPAASLAHILGLNSGIPLGALLGGLFGAWLVLGGSRRVAASAGFFIGIGVVFAAWSLAQPYFWIVDILMNEVFGEGGEQYSGLVLFFIAILLFRAVAAAGAGLVGSLVERQRGRAPPSERGQI